MYTTLYTSLEIWDVVMCTCGVYQLKWYTRECFGWYLSLLPPQFLRSWKGNWRSGEWMQGVQDQDSREILKVSTQSVQSQKSASALRDRWIGWEGDLASRFLGSRSRVWARDGKSGRSFGLKSQHWTRMSFTSLLACRFARVGRIPLPTCQIIASGGCSFQGHSPVRSSYQTVPNA